MKTSFMGGPFDGLEISVGSPRPPQYRVPIEPRELPVFTEMKQIPPDPAFRVAVYNFDVRKGKYYFERITR